ncbi:protein FANTASTIC FOUR 1-like [Benincasa hispida]|uniref:protein FANTASTIC FOUR 1-like n=1 Tax=Benincasa hispida TaxID=102211 RepID=UPI0018FF6622|nr:protein FANTASTIC FOUR 1-like [Benincasa hispida]
MTMMMSFYRKSLHSFLSFTDNLSSKSSPPFNNSNSHLELHHGLGLGLINSDHNLMQFNKSPNILESSSLIKPPLSPSPSSATRKDPRGVGFIEDVGGGVDGLMSCTETLGFESSDERLVNDELTTMEDGGGSTVRIRRRKVVEERKFPPPLTSLNQHGHPNFYLRPVRKDGRLELTEIRIERTEILRACRGDGRLRLHLIKDEELGQNDGRSKDNIDNNDAIEEENDEKNEEEEVEEAEDLVKEEKMELRRCVVMMNHQRRREHRRGHHHQHLDVWRQHCVTTS